MSGRIKVPAWLAPVLDDFVLEREPAFTVGEKERLAAQILTALPVHAMIYAARTCLVLNALASSSLPGDMSISPESVARDIVTGIRNILEK